MNHPLCHTGVVTHLCIYEMTSVIQCLKQTPGAKVPPWKQSILWESKAIAPLQSFLWVLRSNLDPKNRLSLLIIN